MTLPTPGTTQRPSAPERCMRVTACCRLPSCRCMKGVSPPVGGGDQNNRATSELQMSAAVCFCTAQLQTQRLRGLGTATQPSHGTFYKRSLIIQEIASQCFLFEMIKHHHLFLLLSTLLGMCMLKHSVGNKYFVMSQREDLPHCYLPLPGIFVFCKQWA